MQIDLFIKPVALWEILGRFQKALADSFPDKAVSSWSISTAFGGDTLNLNSVLGRDIGNTEEFKQKLQEYKERPFVEATRIQIPIHNGWQLSYLAEDNNKAGPLLRLNGTDNPPNPPAAFTLANSLNKHFTIIPKSEVAALTLSETQLRGFEFAQRVVAGLASETAKISTAATTNFENFVAGVKERSLELEEQFQKKADDLEARFIKKTEELEASHTLQQKELEVEKNAHAEEVKKFELRNNTAVRRDLLREIRTKIEEQKTIQISSGTISKRKIIHSICIFTMILSTGVIAAFVSKIVSGEGTLDWKLFIPLGTGTALFVTTGIYYLRWTDQWFRDHARVEFENRKFSADILRASWVAELFFEWAEKKGINMPPDLVNSFTKNLFDPTTLDGRLHPLDQFNDFLKTISSVEMSKGTVKVTKKAPEEPK